MMSCLSCKVLDLLQVTFILQVVPESGFEVTRRILVDFEGISLRKKFSKGLEPNSIHMMIGLYFFTCFVFINNCLKHSCYILRFSVQGL